jgi:hypothetical protein
MSTIVKIIRALTGFAKAADADLIARATAVLNGMTGNTHFTAPPIDLAALKAAIDSLSALVAAALDGSKKVIAEKKRQRVTVTMMLNQLARYVEANCHGDLSVFQTSGFQAASPTKVAKAPLTEKIRKLEHGHTGQILVFVKKYPKAQNYQVRFAPANSPTPIPWVSQLVPTTKTPATLSGLTPTTVYIIQARAATLAGYTDWSDSVTFTCT